MKFSENTKEFKKNLIKLRDELNITLKNGKLEENFEDKLLDLEKRENLILKELLPYYRLYAPDLYETKINFNQVEIEGSYKSETYLKTYLKIKEDVFLFADSNRKLYFARILDKVNPKIELSSPIKDFYKLIIYMHKIDEERILAFTINGDIFIFSYKDVEDVFENVNYVKIVKLKSNFIGFESIINLKDNIFFCQVGKNELLILEFNEEYSNFKVKGAHKISIKEDEITSLVKISSYDFAMGTRKGYFIEAKYLNEKIEIIRKVKIYDASINKIEILENGKSEKNHLAILGKKGNLALYNFVKKKIIKIEKEKFKGNLFNIISKNGTGIILTEDGFVYLLEENFCQWKLNEKVGLSERFFINLIPLDKENFLTEDIYGNFYKLNIDRLDSVEKLHNIDLCE
ncbi:MAG: hypothetical protein E6249_06595 [Peptoniphilus grossensis]|uniref:hypothetical protein n=1 Tax=Peptoniphilus grossensis TaxID=1465756 RepID=UPI00258CA963|nr:hypothetical protein [Peptoniphilus grossensis]MDU5100124.1 hypothetical protein [Peptoniphilus grossensis]